MIFQYTWEQVIAGKKTQTRRIVKPNEVARYDDSGRIHQVLSKGRVKWQVGKAYGVQPHRTASSIARIYLTGIRQENIAEVSATDAIAEGSANREDYLQLWRHIHGDSGQNVLVWVLEFALVADLPLRQINPYTQ